MRGLCSYDLVGFQTVNDLSAFYDYIVLEAGGEVLSDGVIRAFGRTFRAGVFPIGVDVGDIVELAAKHGDSPDAARRLPMMHGRHLIIGVDRQDSSTGLTDRLRAFEATLPANPKMTGRVSKIGGAR